MMASRENTSKKILIVTGGFLSAKDESLWRILKKQTLQTRYAQDAWLETKVKATMGEPILLSFLEKRRQGSKLDPAVRDMLDARENFATPELTEVVLMTLIRDEGLDFDAVTYDDILNLDSKTARKLEECECIFASSTFLRDLSELEPLVKRLKRPGNRIVVGGALAGMVHKGWEGIDEIDILAVGYGELLVKSLAQWIRSGYRDLPVPATGRIEKRKHSLFLFSGVPKDLSLDFLPTPDWKLAETYHATDYSMIHYESVRGCPYRCAFCNYPYLFDDTKFRTKSAKKMAQDWKRYSDELNVKYITCLDSLFTMPKRRLIEFCEELIRLDVRVKWICYARADDLCDETVVQLMKKAGAIQVQIGLESGDPQQLVNMNKKTTPEQNAVALENCRKYGITSVTSLVVGFPGESEETLEKTFEFMKAAPPDFHFLCTFSTRVPGVPILMPENSERFGLLTQTNSRTVSPYWVHDSMSCEDVGNHVRRLARRLVEEKISLDATIYYRGILKYKPETRAALLEFQRQALMNHPIAGKAFNVAHAWIDRNLAQRLRAAFPDRKPPENSGDQDKRSHREHPGLEAAR